MTTTVTFHVGDVRDVLASMADSSVHLLVTSPPFLALRSYLPAGHPDKHREIGSEPTPAAFLDTMLGLSADWRRVVADWGSICVEIGDTYSGAAGYGQPEPTGPYGERSIAHWEGRTAKRFKKKDDGWPLAKSLCGIPTLYTWSLAYGVNLLTGQPSPAGQWRIRNLLTWTRPNPPVGALGDKFRPATSFVTVACVSDRRWFDLDAVRVESRTGYTSIVNGGKYESAKGPNLSRGDLGAGGFGCDPAGAPPLDWWDTDDCDNWQPLHRLPTQPYKGSHYATYPIALPRRLIDAMCPREVCETCGEGRRRVVEVDRKYRRSAKVPTTPNTSRADLGAGPFNHDETRTTLGWTDCGHGNYRPGIVLDPFGGSGTTAVAAALSGRDAVLIDIDRRNVDLARHRIAEHCTIDDETVEGDTTVWTVRPAAPSELAARDAGQGSLFEETA